MQPLRFPRLLATCALLLTLAGPLCAQTNWTVRHEAAGTGGEFLWGVVEGANGIVTVGTGGKILHSADGRLWATRSSGFTGWLVAVAYGNGRYVAVGEGGAILTSPDGVTWARVAASGTTARLNNVLFAQNRFVAVGESGTLVTSVDGLAWSSLASGVGTAWLHGLAFGDGVWLTTGQGGAVSLSTDGVRWTRQTNSSVQDLEAVAFISLIRYVSDDGNHTFLSRTFLTVGAPGVALWCTYGVFTYENSPADNRTNFVTSSPLHLDYTLTPPSYVGGTASPARLRSLTNATDVLLATGEGGTVLSATSPHGPWKKVAVPTTKNLVAAGLVQGGFLLVGENETILQSEVIYHSRLGNLSTRGVASAGSGAMIAGTVIAGPRPAAILIRGLGPALTGFGVSGALADPVLTVFDQRGNPVATNSGWSTAPNAAFIAASAGTAGAFPLAPGSRDAALLLSLAPGNYTFQLGSAGNSAGNALIEAYILDTIDGTSPRPVNLATRGTVGTGDDLLIAGLVVQGQSARTVLVRGVGPGLGAFGVPGTLPDPLLKIIAADGTELATNDNWSQPTATAGRTFTLDEIVGITRSVGAFDLPAGSKDAVLVLTLPPGSYTIQVSGVNHTTGIALVEAYDLPNT